MNLYLLSYNNYYNRQVKKFDTLAEYNSYFIGQPLSIDNFNPNDGIDTQQIVNWEYDIPDYVLVTDSSIIVSRWFVIEAKRIRKNQYLLTLRRDVMADNYNDIIKSPCFIERATVSNDNPLIYNPERMSFNQIKTTETLLKDRSDSGWLVGYFARTNGSKYPPTEGENAEEFTELSGSVKATATPDIVLDAELSTWEHANLFDTPLITPRENEFSYGFAYESDYLSTHINDQGVFIAEMYEGSTNFYEGSFDIEGNERVPLRYAHNQDFNKQQVLSLWNYNKTKILTGAQNVIGVTSNKTWELVNNLLGKVIRYKEGDSIKYGRFTLSGPTFHSMDHDIVLDDGALYNASNAILFGAGLSLPTQPKQNPMIHAHYEQKSFIIEPVDASTFSYNIPKSRIHTVDAPYDLFCIPYGDVTINNLKGETIKPNKELMMNIVTAMAEKHGKVIYDVQLLPYCPIQSLISAKGQLNAADCIEAGPGNIATYSPITQTSSKKVVGAIFFVTYSAFTLNIALDTPITITEPKIQNECDMYRLVSPNYNGQFEFNAAKNGGVNSFNVDCNYIPFSPYIHVNPDFKKMYGRDFNDARGLICGGDFSIGRVSDAWVNYKLNNKNYLDMFNRETVTLNKQAVWGFWGDAIKAFTGAAVGAAGGAGIGQGMGKGTNGMAAAGAGLSLGGGVADVIINNLMRTEGLRLRKDMFEFQNGNIQAIPDSIAKTTAITYNNKIFPVLEYYTATEQEKQALRNKIKYNGMNVSVIGTIQQFLQTEPSYIQGELIRLEGIKDDYHNIAMIADEIRKGIFI